jgi:hypothetical protein
LTLIYFNEEIRIKKSFKFDLNLFILIFLFSLLLIWFIKAPQPRFAYGSIPVFFSILFINIFKIDTKINYLNLKNKLNFVICFIIIFTAIKNFSKEDNIIYNFHFNKKISHTNTNFTFDKRETFGKKPNFQNLCSSEKNCYSGQDRTIEKLKFNYKKIK